MTIIEFLSSLTAITDPVANVAIIGCAVMLFKHHMKLERQDIRLTNLEREVFTR
ncbi:hypothetical protein [Kordiimonas sp.]|uniref:hypothetical protein n=1 Tax=Kordiimonas sp. TaxID=1970157 RepID=UPI003A8DB21E